MDEREADRIAARRTIQFEVDKQQSLTPRDMPAAKGQNPFAPRLNNSVMAEDRSIDSIHVPM